MTNSLREPAAHPQGEKGETGQVNGHGNNCETTLLKRDTIPVCYVSPGTVLGKLDA
jgi:hypothetical protein